nr:MAG TPA: hypothetical protein [Caudoviricetes sp.]
MELLGSCTTKTRKTLSNLIKMPKLRLTNLRYLRLMR